MLWFRLGFVDLTIPWSKTHEVGSAKAPNGFYLLGLSSLQCPNIEQNNNSLRDTSYGQFQIIRILKSIVIYRMKESRTTNWTNSVKETKAKQIDII